MTFLEGKDPQKYSMAITKTDIYTIQIITVAKLQLQSSNESDFVVGGHHKMRNCVKGFQRQEG